MSNSKALTWSYGGGTQSAAIAVLIAQGRLPKPEISVMADTGREATETWDYLKNNIQPLLDSVGVTIEIAPRSLATVDLYDAKGTLLIPVFTAEGKFRTFCSDKWKAAVVKRYLRKKGYGPKNPVKSWLGFSLDEINRVKESNTDWQELAWPLLFDISPAFTRRDCRDLVLSVGLPEPPKSSCWMCPHRQNGQWARLKEHYPADWQAAVDLDNQIRASDRENGVYLHHSRVALVDADLSIAPPPEHPLFGRGEGCETSNASCWT